MSLQSSPAKRLLARAPVRQLALLKATNQLRSAAALFNIHRTLLTVSAQERTTMMSKLAARTGWGLLLLLPAFPILYAQLLQIDVNPRPGLTKSREELVRIVVLIATLLGFTFNWGPLLWWPTFAAILSAQLVVSGMSALHHTLLLVFVGVVVGLVHDGLKTQFADKAARPNE